MTLKQTRGLRAADPRWLRGWLRWAPGGAVDTFGPPGLEQRPVCTAPALEYGRLSEIDWPGVGGGVPSLRGSVAELTELVLQARAEPFEFFVAARPRPAGGRTEVSPAGDLLTYHPWGLEHAVRIEGNPPSYLVRYCLPVDDAEYLLAYCLDQAPDPLYRLMTGRDHGEQVCELIATHLPTTFQMFRNGNGMSQVPALMRLTTPARRQFAVATFFRDDSPSPELVIPPAAVKDLTDQTMAVVADLLGWPHNVPGLVTILGGEDRIDRGVEHAQQVIEVLGKIGDVLR